MNKTRIFPTVGKQYISRKDDVVVEVVNRFKNDDEWWVDFVNVNNPVPEHPYRYDIDSFWANYKVMEGEDD